MRYRAFGLAFLGVLVLASCATGSDRPAPSVLDLDGRSVDPLAADVPATVFLFVRSDCPISNRYAPAIRRLYDEFAPRGAAFWLVYPDRDETPASIRAHLAEYGYPFGALRDPEHALVRFAGATITPEAALYLRDGRQVYRGRIDDRYVDFGKTRLAPTSHDLARALQAALRGETVAAVTTTQAVGCFIRDLE